MSLSAEMIGQTLRGFFGNSLSFNEPLSKHCTFHIGGPAEFFVSLSSTGNLAAALRFCHEENIPVLVIGEGSNLLFPDEGMKGLVARIALDTFEFQDEKVISQAGVRLPKLAIEAANRGLSGLEFASGIPGTVGGAAIMNAGTWNDSMADVLKQVSGFELTGREFTIDREGLDFEYRLSSLRNSGKLITEVVLKLSPDGPDAIRTRMSALTEKRKEAQPLEYASAGSVFKNLPKRQAWELVEEAGCRGLRIGGAQVSEKHTNFIVNLGGATYRDVHEIMETVIRRVSETSGIALEPEILDMGECSLHEKESL